MSDQLSFIFCMTMGMAFDLSRGQVPRQGGPGGASVGGEGARESEVEKAGGPSGAHRRSERGAGIAGSRLRGAGSLEPWATPPPGAPNKHTGQPLAEPGGLAQGDGVMVLPRADRPRAPTPSHIWMQGPRGWVQVHYEGPHQLRCTVARLWGCGEDDFWMSCEGRVLADDMKLPPDGGHVQVRMRGVGGMHPGFATPNEIEEALREEEERKGTARDGSPSGSKAVKKDKGIGKKMVSFREYTQSELHAQWSLVAPQKDFMRLRMEIQTDLNKLVERRDEWVEKAIKAHGLERTTVELVEYIACYCLLEDLRFDVDTGNFAKAMEEDNEPSSSGINEVLKKLELLEQRLEEVKLGKSEPTRKIPRLSHKELSVLMEMDHKPQWVCRLLVFFKAVLDGQKVDPQLMECTSAWKSSDLQEELVTSPEEAKISEVWTSGAWLEAVTAPMDGSDGGGGPPIPALIANYVEGLWTLLVSTMGMYGELYHQHSGSGREGETPKEVGEPPENFSDTTVPVEEVRRRLASLRSRFWYENGRRIWIPKNNNQQRTDMTDPPATGCRTCKSHGAPGKKHWFFACPYYE